MKKILAISIKTDNIDDLKSEAIRIKQKYPNTNIKIIYKTPTGFNTITTVCITTLSGIPYAFDYTEMALESKNFYDYNADMYLFQHNKDEFNKLLENGIRPIIVECGQFDIELQYNIIIKKENKIMANDFKFYNIEEQFADMKVNTVGMIGFGVDKNGFLFDEETFELLKFKNKFVNVFIESDEYRNVYPMSMMNSRLFSTFFNIFAKQLEEDSGIYIRSFVEENTRSDEFNVSKSRLILHVSNGYTYYSNWYYIPGLKFIEMMYYMTDYSTSINFASMDSYDVAKAYFVRSQELMNFLSRSRKRREKKFYDLQ